MQKKIPFRSPISTAIVLFLIGSIVYGSLNSYSYRGGTAIVSFTKKEAAPAQSDNQLPFEEKEKEAKDVSEEFQDTFFILFQENESTLLGAAALPIPVTPALRFYRNPSNIPLYLVKRTFLI